MLFESNVAPTSANTVLRHSAWKSTHKRTPHRHPDSVALFHEVPIDTSSHILTLKRGPTGGHWGAMTSAHEGTAHAHRICFRKGSAHKDTAARPHTRVSHVTCTSEPLWNSDGGPDSHNSGTPLGAPKMQK